jgi:PAT family beta-lactamase induction signal transducer AmpG
MTNITASQKSSHPIVFLFLFVPFGMVSGYLTVTLAFLYSKAGITPAMIADLVASMLLPQIFKFLWAPLVDVTWSVKKWYILSTFLTAATIFVTGILPVKASVWPVLTVLIILASLASTFVGAAGNSLSAHDTPEDKKGRVSGYIQAGNLGGGSIGGGFGLWIAQRVNAPWVVSGSLALVCVLCCIGLFFVTEVKTTMKAEKVTQTVINVLKDIWQTIKNKRGFLALILCLMPLGSGAAGNLFAAVAKDWHASGDMVAIVTGVVGGLVTTVGCLIGGWLCDLMNRQNAYLYMGLFQGICCIGLAFFPHTPIMYIVWTLLYSAGSGLAYAAFNAFTLEAIGKGAAATKFELYAGVSNVPIMIMTWIAGVAYAKWGAKGMLNTEAVCVLGGIVLFMMIAMAIKSKKVMLVPQTKI